jgi:branched-chain amino acid transport system substrate-binding protein
MTASETSRFLIKFRDAPAPSTLRISARSGMAPTEVTFATEQTNYDLAPALTDRFRKRFGSFMVHEAIESAVTLDVLTQAIERAKSANPKAVAEALHGERFDGGWTKAMPGGAVQFDQTGLNTLSLPIMVQWRNKELVTVWPKDFAKASPVWHSR